MTRHISRHKDKSIDPTGILEARANEEAPEIENVGDAERLEEIDNRVFGWGPETMDHVDACRELLSIARNAVAENQRLRDGIAKTIVMTNPVHSRAVIINLRALLGDE